MIEGREKLFDDLWDTEKNIFKNKALLKVSYIPESLNDVVNREKVIRKLQTCLIDVKQNIAPSNIVIYGKPGTGKTLISRLVLKNVREVAAKHGIKITIINVSCEHAKTENGIIGSINNQLLSEIYGQMKLSIGNSVSRNNIIFSDYFNNLDGILIIILDEIDKIQDPNLINNLTRTISNKNNQPPCLVLITNDINFKDTLKGHTRSVLAENEIQFDPYDAYQLNEILSDRVKKAFYPGVVGEVVVPLCSAFAAQEHGDARKAINLLCKAGEVAEEKGKETIEEEDVREANELIDVDRVTEVVRTLPTQSKLVLYSIIQLKIVSREGKPVIMDDVYNVYLQVCNYLGIDTLTKRRISDLVSELDILGIVNTVVTYKGRHGRVKEISLGVPLETVRKELLQDYRLKTLINFKMSAYNNKFF
jgi:archaeal cell division control protein 6